MEQWIALRGEALEGIDAHRFGGVALVKAEGIAKESGVYPSAEPRRSTIASYLGRVCRHFAGKSVWYRLSCHASSTANQMAGVRHIYEEVSPFLGRLGVRRFMEYPEELRDEFEIIRRVQSKERDLGILLPFVHDVTQFEWVRRELVDLGFEGPIGVMLETPAAALRADKFVRVGAAMALLGLNDLTSLTLGVARYESTVEALFDRSHPAVRRLVEESIGAFRGSGVPIGLAGYLSAADLRTYEDCGATFVARYPRDDCNETSAAGTAGPNTAR